MTTQQPETLYRRIITPEGYAFEPVTQQPYTGESGRSSNEMILDSPNMTYETFKDKDQSKWFDKKEEWEEPFELVMMAWIPYLPEQAFKNKGERFMEIKACIKDILEKEKERKKTLQEVMKSHPCPCFPCPSLNSNHDEEYIKNASDYIERVIAWENSILTQ